ncbi:MAG TPA: mechanosensitive ion channel family protein [Stellaceae bacterium]|nr:mechanosensitive ion channel family protein [Stellaceae bacterium]
MNAVGGNAGMAGIRRPHSISPAARAAALLLLGLALLLVPLGRGRADSGAPDPLRPPDTSSPRATLEGFMQTMNGIELGMTEVLKSYAGSDRLYLSREERQTQRGLLERGRKVLRYLDVSTISPVLHDTVGAERALQLQEILTRIALPSADDIPDRDAVARDSLKKWRLPGTEIDIVRIDNGPRAGEWVFSAATVERLPDFYALVKDLPYRAGPARDLAAVYRVVSHNRASSLYEAFSNSPAGLLLVPPRWMLSLPGWFKARIVGVAVWQWIGLAIVSLMAALFLFGIYRLTRRLDRGRREDETAPHWSSLLMPLAILFVAGAFAPAVLKIMRISGSVFVAAVFAKTAAFYLAAAWLVMTAAGIAGATIVVSEQLRAQSLDSQLIRLMSRFVGIVLAIALLMEGANELGFPAFSVLAGLGVGGLAVALAARDSLANLFGSVLIMFEKPFRVGHFIRLGATAGTVEDVGFRSTRIRTGDNSVISIPNNTIVNATVENLSLRTMLRQNLLLQIGCNTPGAKVQAFCRGIERIFEETEAVDKGTYLVRFNDFGESSLNIIATFNLIVANRAAELSEREAILLKIMEMARKVGVAFPDRDPPDETATPEMHAASGG